MIVTTTSSIDGKRIIKYCGVIAGEVVLGINFFKDSFARIDDVVEGRSNTYEKELRRARSIVLDELQERAAECGANAVVAVDIDYQLFGKGSRILLVSASGTTVVVE